ncbi:MAG TPA: hypothetical protein PLP55_02660 [Phycicoccus elongatus]|uniref:hypothetical protein n=1 Tax=Phycicoccus TaxID=367298 RepID=UPI001D46E787|nr:MULTISPECIES: hypothetical protein [Phycicoccus]MCB1240029.1 hypothetical protein [Tetrasphaera sp.]MCB9405411.1 hypothetical protein [Tetrasphaera sp.]MCO5302234.1 hypothetical protein [Phycicoccus sp.]HPK11557.1 hypothetical protein [Phycicoccus elongatus]HPK11565.1 hypothetical protein [Phycicoccus elongatus]
MPLHDAESAPQSLAWAEPLTHLWRSTVRPRFAGRQVLAGLAGVHVVAVAVLSAVGGLHIDDIRAQAYAAGRPIWPFVVESNRTHLSPGARTVDWLMATFAPLEHWPAVVLTVLIAALYAWSVLALVTRILRRPRVQVLAVSWLLFGATVVPTYAWFRQALTTMLPMALMVMAVVVTLDGVRRPRPLALVLAVALHAVALSFSERALILPVVLAALLVLAARGQLLVRRSWIGIGLRLLPHVALNIAFLLAYRSGEFDTGAGSTPSIGDAAVKLGRWFVVDALPSLVGGPVLWRPGNGPYSFADPPWLVVAAGIVLVTVVTVVAVRRRPALRGALPTVVVCATYAFPALALIYLGRFSKVTDVTSGDDLRLLPDAVAAIAIALAAVLEVTWVSPARPTDLRIRRVIAAAGAGLTAVLCAISWIGFGNQWSRTPVTAYLDQLRTTVGAATGPVVPSPLPNAVLPAWVDPSLTTAPLIELVNPGALEPLLGGDARVITDSGALAPVRTQRVLAADIPGGFCGVGIPEGRQSATVNLPSPAQYYRGSIITVGLLAGDATRINLTAIGSDGVVRGPLVSSPPELLRGPHRIYALVPYGTKVATVRVDVVTPNSQGVCLTSVQVERLGATR